MRWGAGDWMIAVQWYSESDNGEYLRDQPCIEIFNSSELRLAGFPAEQSRGHATALWRVPASCFACGWCAFDRGCCRL